jgi:antitoxin (DNA-binding transcriptional repressor) of toxin-antitoxin stability system
LSVICQKEVVLTERGQPIAVIKPIKEAPEPETVLKRMADEGLILDCKACLGIAYTDRHSAGTRRVRVL